VGLAVLVVAALVAGGVFVAGRGGAKHNPGVGAQHNPVPKPTVSATIPVLARADHPAFAFGATFVTESTSKRLARIDPNGNRVTQLVTLPHTPHAIGATSEALWVSSADAPTIMRVRIGADPSQTSVTDVPIGAIGADLTTGAGAVWATDAKLGNLLRIDPSTNKVTATIPVGATPDSVIVDQNGVWVANRLPQGTVKRIDPATNTVVATIPVGAEPDQVAAGAGSVWSANRADGTISRIDPATNQVVARISVGGHPKSVIAGAGAIWVSESSGNTVLRIDPATNTVTATVTVGQRPEHGAVGAGSIWIANPGDDTISRIEPGT
ncbi:MAG TPA: hypothetical protein VGP92_04980, partial [Acidimicrobiia bacterium]|nr:hypothetical protein [Acidimicrobiia bacterium]